MTVKSGTMVVLSIGIVLLGIAVTSAFGLWTTQSTKTPKKLSPEQISSQTSIAAASGSADLASVDSQKTDSSNDSSAIASDILEYDPDDIKGSYTFLEISNLYKIPIPDLAAAFMVEESAAKEFKCKDLEGIFSTAPNEIGTASVRLFVSLYYGLNYKSTEEIYLPESAMGILKQHGRMTPDQLLYLESHTVQLP